MTAREVFEETKFMLNRPAEYLVMHSDGRGDCRGRTFAVVVAVYQGCPEYVVGTWPLDDCLQSEAAYFRLAAWCSRQGEFMSQGETLNGEEG